MNEMQVFSNPEFGSIRTIEENGNVLFSATDTARALGYSNPRDAISRHCKGVVKRDAWVQTGEKADGTPAARATEMSFIPESDIYRLVFGSKLPTAEKFTDWVTDEVLPSIRRNGAYMTPEVIERTLTDPDYIIQLATTLKEEQQRRRLLERQAEADRPKVLFADAVSASHTSILVGELAKLLRQNGVDIGQNRLFSWLRDNGYLIRRSGTDYNMPTQRSMEMGLFDIKETAITRSDGSVTVSKTVKVTGRGQTYFVNRFLSNREGRKCRE
nr:MAG TPA: repressor domain protein [Caudoviricetes sp.]